MENNVYLVHHGIKGMHWGIRRYQNSDGTLTEAGKNRYMRKAERLNSSYQSSKRSLERKVEKHRRYMNRPWLFSYDSVGFRLNQKVYKADKKLQKRIKKGAAFFEEEMKSFSNRGFNDEQIKHLSEIGENFIDRQKR